MRRCLAFPINVRYDTFGTSSKNPVSHGFGVLGWLISIIPEKRLLLFFGIVLGILTVIGLIFGANVLYIANMGRGVCVWVCSCVSVVRHVHRAYIEYGWKMEPWREVDG